MTRIKAAVAHAFGQPLSIEEVELAQPKSGEVEVTLDACAICHSDITYLDGGWGGSLPAVYGHEAAGRISRLGDGVTGLTPNGNWIDIPKIDGTFVVNIGDMLNRLSNGFLKSTPHRVINRSGSERYSIPFFFDPHVNTIIEPLRGTGEPNFEPIHFGDFLRNELGSSYESHKKISNKT